MMASLRAGHRSFRAEPVWATAELLSVSKPEITVVSRLWGEGKERVTGTAVWKRWRQR